MLKFITSQATTLLAFESLKIFVLALSDYTLAS